MVKKNQANKELPFDGEFFLSKNKKFQETIFFVHFYDGSKRQLLRHIRLVNELGFDAFAFQLQGHHKDLLKAKLPLTSKGGFGVKHAYAEQITTLLNLIPGQKIIFSFSNPTAAAIEAMAQRHCSDVRALVCDSGPTARFIPSAMALYKQEHKSHPFPLRLLLSPVLSLGWSPFLHKDLHKDLATFPADFRILSIRGWKDPLIPPTHIDEVFEPHQQIQWSRLALPEAEHLNGLRDFRSEYVPGVEKFLRSVATAL